MAIIIPSKNIYNKHNPKIIDNVINNVSVNTTFVAPQNEYDVNVFRISINKWENLSPQTKDDFKSKTHFIGQSTTNWNEAIAYAYLYTEFGQISYTFPRLKNNRYIQNYFFGKDKEGNREVKISYIGKKIITPMTAKANYNSMMLEKNLYDIQYGESIETREGYIILPPLSVTSYASSNTTTDKAEIDVTVSLDDIGEDKDNSEDDDNAILQSSFRTKYIDRKLKFGGTFNSPTSSYTLTLSGEETEYKITQVEISIYGDTIGINLEDGTVLYETGNKPFSLEGSEILQNTQEEYIASGSILITEITGDFLTGRTFYFDIIRGYIYPWNTDKTVEIKINNLDVDAKVTKLTETTGSFKFDSLLSGLTVEVGDELTIYSKTTIQESLSFNIIDSYKNGKETAVLMCDIGEYYDETGTLSISTKSGEKMVFDIGDEVIPMIYGTNGTDMPMSLKSSGNPKTFRVVGTNIIFDGAVWQEISFQEI